MAAYLARPTTAPASYEITDSGNSTMKVVVRLRPENEDEIRSNNQAIAKVLDEHVLLFDPSPDNCPTFSAVPKKKPILGRKHKDLRFAFDKVFDETASQVDIFEHTTKAIVDGVLEGINCSVFAYGATGAGKTYTMLGTVENPGIMFLTMMELYKQINEVREEKTCEVAVSYCEVYNETIHDLLVPSGDLHLREDSQKGLVVTGLSRHIPKSANDVLRMLEAGNENRTQHPTDANATSSRSHAVFQVFVNQKPRATGLTAQVSQAKMSLIDLAGSERATATKNIGERMAEGANINRSLLALGNCINALADSKGKSVHVPYRNSKLTRLLKDSLGGNCRTVMIANISPSGLHHEDTYNTLKYADRAKQIKTKLVPNVLNVDYHVTRYKTIVEELQKENSELKAKLAKKCPKDTFDPVEALRLQGLVKSVYGERSRLRKQMAELDASERETLLKICRKERDLTRVETISGDESRKAKISSRIESLQAHVTEIQRQKQTVNEYLYSNNESVGRVQAEINRECGKTAASPALRQLLETASEARRLETENAHLWKQTKHLLKYIKNQEKEINRSEKILIECLSVVRRQHAMLRASNGLTSSLQEMYNVLVRMAEGEKGVAWADQSLSQQSVDNSLVDVNTSTFSNTQQALFDNFVSHASPIRKMRDIQAGVRGSTESLSYISSSLGILTNSVGHNNQVSRCERHSPEESGEDKSKSSSPTLTDTPSGKRTPLLNGLSTQPSSAKPGTPLFVTTPRTAFTPKNYLKFHPLSENHSHQNGISFTPRFHNRPESSTSNSTATSKSNGYTSPGPNMNSTFTKAATSSTAPYRSPKPVVIDSSANSTPRPAFLHLAYTPLSAVNKPRAPTPIDDGSWSSSQSSTYTTKLHTVLNHRGYYEPERRNAIKRGHSFLTSPPQSDSSSAVSSTVNGCKYLVRNKTKRAEPYLLPRPQLAESKTEHNPSAPQLRTNTPIRVLSRNNTFNAFEDNFVSPVNGVRVKTPVGVAFSSAARTEDKSALKSSISPSLHYRTSPSHSPSPPSSSVSSQSQLSQDRHSTPPSSTLTSHPSNSQLSSAISNSSSALTSNQSSSQLSSAISNSSSVFTSHQSSSQSSSTVTNSSVRPFDNPSSKTLPGTSPVTTSSQLYRPVPTSTASATQAKSRSSQSTSMHTRRTSGAKSPSPIKSQVVPQVSPSRRAKSAESLLPQEKEEESTTSPPPTPSQSKKSFSPSSLSGKFAKAKKLFGIRRNGENGYHRVQSTSLTDISQKPPSPVHKADPGVPGLDLANPQGISLSEGDSDLLNTTFTVSNGTAVKHAFPVPSINGVHKQTSAKNGLNGFSKRRGLFGSRSHVSSSHMNGHHTPSVEERLQAVESAQQRVAQEAAANGGTIVQRKQEPNGARKMPNYLQMTKAAASKRVAKPLLNKENKGHTTQVTGKIIASKSKTSRLLGNRPRDRDLNGGAFKPTATPQLVW